MWWLETISITKFYPKNLKEKCNLRENIVNRFQVLDIIRYVGGTWHVALQESKQAGPRMIPPVYKWNTNMGSSITCYGIDICIHSTIKGIYKIPAELKV